MSVSSLPLEKLRRIAGAPNVLTGVDCSPYVLEGRTPDAVDLARQNLETRLGTRVEPIDPTSAATLSDRIGVTPDLLDVLAPLTGMLLRTQREVVSV